MTRFASGLLEGHAHYVHWGVIQISLANLIVILLMVALFVAALLVPFPRSRDDDVRDEAKPR